MSAYVVQDECINAIVTWITSPRHDWELRMVQEAIAQTGTKYSDKPFVEILANEMFDLNCNAVNQRYGENQAQEFRPLDYTFKPCYLGSSYAVYDCIGEWHYQCAEGNVPETSKLYQAFEHIYANMAHTFFRELRDRKQEQEQEARRELRLRIEALEAKVSKKRGATA